MYEQTIAVFGTTPSDPARLGAQVINGIGFLGAVDIETPGNIRISTARKHQVGFLGIGIKFKLQIDACFLHDALYGLIFRRILNAAG